MLGQPLVMIFIILSPIKKNITLLFSDKQKFDLKNKTWFWMLFLSFDWKKLVKMTLPFHLSLTAVLCKCVCLNTIPRTDSRFLKCVCRVAALCLWGIQCKTWLWISSSHLKNIMKPFQSYWFLASAPPGFTLKRVSASDKNWYNSLHAEYVFISAVYGEKHHWYCSLCSRVNDWNKPIIMGMIHPESWGELLHISLISEFLSHTSVYLEQFAQIFCHNSSLLQFWGLLQFWVCCNLEFVSCNSCYLFCVLLCLILNSFYLL